MIDEFRQFYLGFLGLISLVSSVGVFIVSVTLLEYCLKVKSIINCILGLIGAFTICPLLGFIGVELIKAS